MKNFFKKLILGNFEDVSLVYVFKRISEDLNTYISNISDLSTLPFVNKSLYFNFLLKKL